MLAHSTCPWARLVLLTAAGIISALSMPSPARAQETRPAGPDVPGKDIGAENLTEEALLSQVRSHPDYRPPSPALPAQARGELFKIARDRIANEQTIRVMVGFDLPEYARLRDLSLGEKGPQRSPQADERLAAAIRKIANRELGRLPQGSFEIATIFEIVPSVSMVVDERALQILEASPAVQSINVVEGGLKPLLDDTVNLIEASGIWAQGFEASDWYVAVIDSGILATHEAFAGRNIVQACYLWNHGCPNGQIADTTSPDAARHLSAPCFEDHGTHVSGIAASNGQVDGVARGANLIAIQTGGCVNGEVIFYEDDVAKALQFVYSKRNNYKIASVNLSLGQSIPANLTCDQYWPPITGIVSLLKSAGIATVAASGNDGECFEVDWPACMTDVIAIGATNNFFGGMAWSNTDKLNPDVLDLYAPGDEVYAPVGTANNDYGNNSGTSMASPHVAGGIALMRDVLEQYVPALTPQPTVDQLVSALNTTGWQVFHQWCLSGEPEPQKKIRLIEALGVFLNPSRTWVDFAWSGTENGGWAYPYNTVNEAAQNAADNDTLLMHAGSSAEGVTINRPLTLTALNGLVTIGQ